MPCKVFIACSIDGFIARKDGNLDWLESVPQDSNSDFGYSTFMSQIDAIIMGRKTFEKVLSFKSWPYTKPVFVLSKSLKSLDPELESKASLLNKARLPEILRDLKLKGLSSFYIDGGKTIQSFLSEDLIDEMIITTVALLLGDGIPLFGFLKKGLDFSVIKTECLNSHMIQSTYKRTAL